MLLVRGESWGEIKSTTAMKAGVCNSFFCKTKSGLSEPVRSEEFVVNCDVSIWRGSAFLLSLLLYICVCCSFCCRYVCLCVCLCLC